MSGYFTTGDPSGYKDGLGIGILKVATKIQSQAKALCPVDTGRLRNSIESGMIDKETGYIGANTEYATAIEFGYKKKPAQPYLRPAVNIVQNPGTGNQVGDALNLGMRKTLRNKKTRKV